MNKKSLAVKFVLALIFCLFLSDVAFAEIKVYLLPKVKQGKAALALGDIASFEGDASAVMNAELLPVNSALLSDGYIDKREVTDILRHGTNDIFFVYGSAVRIMSESEYSAELQKAYEPVKTGQEINVFVKRKSIVIELKGTALSEGAVGEQISVMLNQKHGKGKTIKCRLISSNAAEVTL